MSEYAGRQFVGIDLHRRRTVLVRTAEGGDVLEAVRILNDVDSLTLVFTVVPDHRADDLIDAVAALLEERPGVMFVSGTGVLRPGYFGSG